MCTVLQADLLPETEDITGKKTLTAGVHPIYDGQKVRTTGGTDEDKSL